MRILFITFQFPYPAISGASIKTLSLLDYLRRDHDVRCLSLRRGPPSREQQEWAEGLGGIRTVELDKGRNAWSLLLSYAAGVPLRIERNRSGEMARLVNAQIGEFQPDVLFADGLSMAQYVPEQYPALKLLHEHNAEYLIWQRQSDLETGPRRWLAASEAARLRRYEAAALDRFDIVFAVSQDDGQELLALGADPGRLRILPNIPDPALLEMPPPVFTDTAPVILYFGTLSWEPNIEGLERLLTSILPAVRGEVPEARLLVAGVGASPALASRVVATPGAEFVGEVSDPEPLYRRARVLVDATRSGGGTRLKVLNAFARGVPVVASSLAAQGLDVIRGEHLLIADADDEMSDATALLLRDPDRCRSLSENARALARDRYVAEVAFRPLDEALAYSPAGTG
jgi:glycosyltransferase involved in cell wall biosynthesis